jgi:hypothetical protein
MRFQLLGSAQIEPPQNGRDSQQRLRMSSDKKTEKQHEQRTHICTVGLHGGDVVGEAAREHGTTRRGAVTEHI